MQIAVLPEFLQYVRSFENSVLLILLALFLMQKSADPDVYFLLNMNDKGVTSFSY